MLKVYKVTSIIIYKPEVTKTHFKQPLMSWSII